MQNAMVCTNSTNFVNSLKRKFSVEIVLVLPLILGKSLPNDSRKCVQSKIFTAAFMLIRKVSDEQLKKKKRRKRASFVRRYLDWMEWSVGNHYVIHEDISACMQKFVP